MARIAALVAYPLKSNDGAAVDRAELGPNGALRGDRSYALVEAGVDPHTTSVGGDGGYVNGKREPAVHGLLARYERVGSADATPTAVTLSRPARPETGAAAGERTFALPEDSKALATWVGEYLGYGVDLVREPNGGSQTTGRRRGRRSSRGRRWRRSPRGSTRLLTQRRCGGGSGRTSCSTTARRSGRTGCSPTTERPCASRSERPSYSGSIRVSGASSPRVTRTQATRSTGSARRSCGSAARRSRRGPRATGSTHDFRLMVNTVVPDEEWGSTLAVGDAVAIEGVEPEPDSET